MTYEAGVPGASSLIAEWAGPAGRAGTDPVNRVAHAARTPALLVAALPVPTVRTLILALYKKTLIEKMKANIPSAEYP